MNYVPSPFDRFEPVSDDDSPVYRENEPYINVYSQRNFSVGHNHGDAQTNQGEKSWERLKQSVWLCTG